MKNPDADGTIIPDAAAFGVWLSNNYQQQQHDLWLKIAKKNSGERSVSSDEAVDPERQSQPPPTSVVDVYIQLVANNRDSKYFIPPGKPWHEGMPSLTKRISCPISQN